MHPAKVIEEQNAFVNLDTIENLLVTGRQVIRVKKKEQTCITFRHDNLPNVTLHSVECHVVVVTEGPEEFFYPKKSRQKARSDEGPFVVCDALTQEPIATRRSSQSTTLSPPSIHHLNDVQYRGTEVPQEILGMQNHTRGETSNEDIAIVRGMGFVVDDDNDPLPENIPGASDDDTESEEESQTYDPNAKLDRSHDQEWTADLYACPRKAKGYSEFQPSVPEFRHNPIKNWSFIDLFVLFFGMDLLHTILEATNNMLEVGVSPISFGEFIRFIGLRFKMSTCNGFAPSSFWKKKDEGDVHSAPHFFGEIMTKHRFDQISKSLAFTTNDPPEYRDKFWKVRQMQDMWNENMKAVFHAGWVVCLDESMCIWTSRWTCPGWMFVPRKPHPWGNEYHTIACGICVIIFFVLLVEGKDRPPEIPDKYPGKSVFNLCGFVLL